MSAAPIHLSRRTAWTLEVPRLESRAAELRARGVRVHDLRVTNPTEVGLLHPDASYQRLGDPRARRYAPHPLGMPAARRAVSAYYAARGVTVPPDRIWLTAGTSEAYAHLLTLLCDPGDAVLAPRPGYPLLDVLADTTNVELIPYPLHYDGRWSLDVHALSSLARRSTSVRAIVVVAPNNPTGNYLKTSEVSALAELATAKGLPLIVDEVFADYPLRDDPDRVPHVAGIGAPLTFVLSGLSKVAALPQMKLSWVAVHGEDAVVGPVLERAEVLEDAFLSVSTPVQLALAELFAAAEPVRDRIRARTLANLDALRRLTADTPLDVLDVEGGWTAVVRLPQLGDLDDDDWALSLLEGPGVLVQPGSPSGLSGPPKLVVSLLPESSTFCAAVSALAEHVRDRCRAAASDPPPHA